jgi:gliding motility-associated-like protein
MNSRTGLAVLFSVISLLGWSQEFFIPNVGQWPEEVLAKTAPETGDLYITQTGSRIHWRAAEDHEKVHGFLHGELDNPPVLESTVFDISYSGANPQSVVRRLEEGVYTENYFLRDVQATGATSFKRLIQEEFYPKIDRVLYFAEGEIKYDFVVRPGGDAEKIVWRYSDFVEVDKSRGQLIAEANGQEFIDGEPYAYQEIDGSVEEVRIRYKLRGDSVYFSLGSYDEALPLIIDPNFIFSSFTGSTADNFGFTATYGPIGELFAAGIVRGVGYPTTVGVIQDTFQGGHMDVGITAFAPDGKSLVYSTYLGGSEAEQPHSMMADSQGNLYVFGITSSLDFPTTPTAYDTSYNGGVGVSIENLPFVNGSDIFVTALSPQGNQLVGSTYYGGSLNDGFNQNLKIQYGDHSKGEVYLGNNKVYIASSTLSLDIPTVNAIQDSSVPGQDALLLRFNKGLTQLEWATYFGAAGAQGAMGCKLNDVNGLLYAVGTTTTAAYTFPSNAYEPNFLGGARDGFIAAFDTSTFALIYGTYNGTANADGNYAMDVDFDGEVYLTGLTNGLYPRTPGLFGNQGSQYFHHLSADLTTSIKSITFGTGQQGKIDLAPTAFLIDDCKNLFYSAWFGSLNNSGAMVGNLPVSDDALYPTHDGNDFYFFTLGASWQKLEYATYFGGDGVRDHVDGGTSRFSKDGLIFQAVCAGCGGSSDFPIFPLDVWSPTNGSQNCNAAGIKIDFEPQNVELNVYLQPDSTCVPYLLDVKGQIKNTDVLIWDYGDGSPLDTTLTPTKIYNNPGKYTIGVVAMDTVCNGVDSTELELTLYGVNLNAKPKAIYQKCDPNLYVFIFDSLAFSSWVYIDWGDGTSTNNSFDHNYSSPGFYSITYVLGDTLCGMYDTTFIPIEFFPPPVPIEFSIDFPDCSRPEIMEGTILEGGYTEYIWSANGESDTGSVVYLTVDRSKEVQIEITAIDTFCQQTDTVRIVLTPAWNLTEKDIMPNVFTPNADGVNDRLSFINAENLQAYENIELQIFNRWGNVVFETGDINFSWDGEINGAVLPEGVYLWVLKVSDACGAGYQWNSSIHLFK